MRTRRDAALLAILTAALATGCRAKPRERMKVVVSVSPVDDLVRRVAGADADVALIGGEEVTGARMAVLVGLGLDGWLQKLVEAQAPKAKVLKVGDHVPTLETPGGDVDPYVWLDPERAAVMTKAIGEEMARADSGHAAAYRARAEEVGASLEALDREVESETRGWRTRQFATDRGSFAYFADRYHLQVVPADAAHPVIATLEPFGKPPGTRSYEDLVRFDTAALAKALR